MREDQVTNKRSLKTDGNEENVPKKLNKIKITMYKDGNCLKNKENNKKLGSF